MVCGVVSDGVRNGGGAGHTEQADRQVPQEAMTRGPFPVRTWDRSSPSVTSRTQCRRFSMDQWPRSQAASGCGRARSAGRSVTA